VLSQRCEDQFRIDFDLIRDYEYPNVLLHAPIVRSGPGSDLSGIPDNQLRVVARLGVRF